MSLARYHSTFRSPQPSLGYQEISQHPQLTEYQLAEDNPMVGQMWPSTCFVNKILLEHSHTHSPNVYGDFSTWLSWAVKTETVRSTKLKKCAEPRADYEVYSSMYVINLTHCGMNLNPLHWWMSSDPSLLLTMEWALLSGQVLWQLLGPGPGHAGLVWDQLCPWLCHFTSHAYLCLRKKGTSKLILYQHLRTNNLKQGVISELFIVIPLSCTWLFRGYNFLLLWLRSKKIVWPDVYGTN
jgi:hypothetical protein